MKSSESIASLASALSKAQGELGAAKKSSKNPAFGSMYADLSSVIEALQLTLPKYGISYAQFPLTTEHGVGVETLLMHEGGEWLRGEPFYVPVAKENAHGFGSALTYARRYSLAAVCGLRADDDDGNAAAAAPPKSFHHPAGAEKQVAFDALPDDAKVIVREWAMEVMDMVKKGNVTGAAKFVIEKCGTDQDSLLALSSQLEPKVANPVKEQMMILRRKEKEASRSAANQAALATQA